MPVGEFLEFAISVSVTLGYIHKKNEIHGDIRPENINWDSKVKICELTEPVTTETQLSLLDKARLPYMSPEQTGRMSRKVDYRTDFYSLGVVFYEQLTGNPPYISEDPLGIIHSHIAKGPIPPNKLEAEVPEQVSAIVMRLLEKNAGDRYQSAMGLRHDLERCFKELNKTGTIKTFKLGKLEYSGIFQIPQKLYGRDNEIKTLLDSFDRVSLGKKSLLLVAGYSGVGKSALVHEVQKPITAKLGFFIGGKFDQYQRNIPYSAWGQAFSRLMDLLVMEGEAQLTIWKSRILEAVGPNGSVLTDLIPKLENIIGIQPEVPELGGTESRNRLNYVFQSFIKVIARKEHPLVLFMDDLQWIDAASLNLLKALLTDPDLTYFLIIGAYRNNEVDPTHPLIMWVAELQKENINFNVLTLENLTEADVNALSADTLHTSQQESQPLTQLIYSKAAGNAFFTHQILHALNEEDLLTFDAATHRWYWDTDAVQAMESSDNVVELIVRKVRKLPTRTQEALKLAACIGYGFELTTLATIAGESEEAMQGDLKVAFREGFLVSLSDRCKFVHDRVQQAAYSLFDADELERTHLHIGRVLLAGRDSESDEFLLLDIVGHLNLARNQITTDPELIDLANLNLKAARQAKLSSAFDAGCGYCTFGIKLLPKASWDLNYDITVRLFCERAALAYMAGDMEALNQYGDEAVAKARKPLDVTEVIKCKIGFLTGTHRQPESIELGLETLAALGIQVEAHPEWPEVVEHLQRTIRPYRSNEIDLASFQQADEGEDLWLDRVTELITAVLSAAYISRPALCPILTITAVELCIERHRLPSSFPFLQATMALYISALLGEAKLAQMLCNSALDLTTRPAYSAHRSSSLHASAMFVEPWNAHLEETIALSVEGFQAGRMSGDIEFTAMNIYGCAAPYLYASCLLPEVIKKLAEYGQASELIGFELQRTWLNIFYTAAILLQDYKGETPWIWHESTYDDKRELEAQKEASDGLGLFFVYTTKMFLATLFRNAEATHEYYLLANEQQGAGVGMFLSGNLTFLSGLFLAELEERTDDNEKELEEGLKKLSLWSETAPMNFTHKHKLVLAVKFSKLGNYTVADPHYDRAIEGAIENRYLDEAALACELFAESLRDRGLNHTAMILTAQAANLYRRWGALAKVKDLETRYPQLLTEKPEIQKEGTAFTTGLTTLDLNSVIKASRAMAGEIVLDRLLIQVMQIVIENSGAQKGFLLLEHDGKWFIEAEGGTDGDTVQELKPVDVQGSDAVPSSIINYTAHTREQIILNDAANEGDFTGDPVVKKCRSKSILCIPLINQGRISGILYLENNLVTGAFIPERVELLSLLSSQMALALDNARLYKRLEARLAQFRATFEQAAAGIAHASPEGKFLRINQKFCEIVGYSREEMLKMSFQKITHPDDLEVDLVSLRKLLTKETDNYSLEKRYYRKDGSIVWVILTVSLLSDHKGIPDYLVGVIQDISKRKQAEEQLLAYKERLRALALKLTITEEQARRQISEELHDGPAQSLAFVRLQLASASMATAETAQSRKLADVSKIVHESIRQIRSVILALSPPSMKEIGLAAAISECLEQQIGRRYELRTSFTDASDERLLSFDIQTILFRNTRELLMNAAKHAQADRLSVKMESSERTFWITVEDDGVGFSTDAVSDLPDHRGGYGLFSIAERMADMKGSLEMVAAPGKGCKATLVVPIEHAEERGSQ